MDDKHDTRYDHRRPTGKINSELPPVGVNSMVVIGHSNYYWKDPISGAATDPIMITFHELSETYAEVDLGYQYTGSPSSPQDAIRREGKWIQQFRNLTPCHGKGKKEKNKVNYFHYKGLIL